MREITTQRRVVVGAEGVEVAELVDMLEARFKTGVVTENGSVIQNVSGGDWG